MARALLLCRYVMSTLDIVALRDRLRSRRRELVARYQHARELADEELDSREIEAEENAAELWDARVLSAMGEVDRRAVTQLDAALARLDAGTYGRCEACDEAIDAERLDALPEAELCLGCKLEAERA
jgi:RNA polymerase-binding transcription factor DksA